MNERKSMRIENGQLIIGDIPATELREKFGTPLYVLDEQYIREVSKAFKNGIQNGYNGGKTAVAFASKSLSNIAVMKITSSEGLYTDVVSGGEIFIALNSGVDPKKMVFHGNNKTEEEIEMAIKNGVGHIVLDSFLEIERLQKFAEKNDAVQNVLIRTNPLVEAHTHSAVQTAKADSKFGIIVGDEVKKAIAKIDGCSNLHFAGLHSHIGSQIFDYSAFEMAIDVMTKFVAELDSEGTKVDVLNIGGGFGVYYTDEDPKFSAKRYEFTAKNLAMMVAESFEKLNVEKPMLMIEPGRAIVGEAGVTLYTVGTIKDLGVRKYVAVDGGMFENPRYALYKSKYSAIIANKATEPLDDNVSICGKCCESGDLIGVDMPLQKSEIGDLVAVFTTGAYNYSMASNYNVNPIPPMVLVNGDKAEYIVKPQTYEDIIRLNNVASWLK